MTRLHYIFSLLFFCCFYTLAFSQAHIIRGTVRDARTSELLPFVSVVANNGETGTTTNLDGSYYLQHKKKIFSLRFSYVGYAPQQLLPDSTGKTDIFLEPAAAQLQEVVIRSGENPAHRIIRLATENRNQNRISKLDAYTYRTYNKMILTANGVRENELSSTLPLSKKDSAYYKMQQLLEKQHLFLIETITDFAYLKPARTKETIVATRVSGLQQPSFGIVAEEAREFSVYEDLPVFFGKRYLSPLSTGSIRRYNFVLQEITTAGTDTVYIISFKPVAGKNFNGLKGLLYINSKGWAVQNVIAESADEKSGMKLQQQFNHVDGRQWFPSAFDVEITSPNLIMNGHQLFGYVRTFITDVNLKPDLKKSDFGIIALSQAPQAHKTPELVWEQIRPDTLSLLEQRTYTRLDSVGKKRNLDRSIRIMEYLLAQQIPVGPLSLDIPRLLRFSQFEGIRLGIGLHTNKSFSERFGFGGYWGYGLQDDASKYGADAFLILHQPSELKVSIAFEEDVQEPGARKLPFIEKGFFDQFREPLLPNLDYSTSYRASLSGRPFRYLQVQTMLLKEERRPTLFSLTPDQLKLQYKLTEASVGIRYAFGEQKMKLFNQTTTMPGTYPVFWLQYTRGLDNLLDGNFNYHKYDLRAEGKMVHRTLGESSAVLTGGFLAGKAPFVSLYNGYGSYNKDYYLYTGEGFETMTPYEFFSDRYASIFLTHNFGKRLLRTKLFKPDVLVITNIGVGNLSQDVPLFLKERSSSMSEGFYESGLLLNNIINSPFTGIGVGLFYRYGPYALPDSKDNLKLKITATIAF
jgi:hypothetical protein